MAIKFSDLIENININYPVVDAGNGHVKGVIFADLGEPLSGENISSIPATKRGLNSIVVDKAQETIYIYKGGDILPDTWGNVDNWVKVSGGAGGGTSLGDDDSYTTELLQDNNAAIGDFTLETTYTYAIDKLNELMGKIVPTAPSALNSLPLDSVSGEGSSDTYNNIYTDTSFITKLEYAALRATSNGIPSAYGGSTVSSNTVVRWLKSPTTSINIKFTGLTSKQANPGDVFEVFVNGSAVNNTRIELPESISNGSTYTNESVAANKLTLSSTGYPASGSGAGFYTTYSTIEYTLGNVGFEESKYNEIVIKYNSSVIGSAYFYLVTEASQSNITSSITSQSIPSLSPSNFDNAIRFVTADDMDTNANRFSMSISLQTISGQNAYGVSDYQTTTNSYAYGQGNGVLLSSGAVNYPSSVPQTATGSLTVYYYPDDEKMGLFDLNSSTNYPKAYRRSAFGGNGTIIAPTSTGEESIRYWGLLVYPTDSIPSDAFWSGRTIIDSSVSDSYSPSVGGLVSSASRVKDPGAGVEGSSFTDTPSGITSSDLYDARYASGSVTDGVLIHKSDAIVAFGKAMHLTQAELSPYLDGNSVVPNQQNYSVDVRDSAQYVTMGLTITGAAANLDLTLDAPNGISGAWIFMDDNGVWETANGGNNGWVTLNQPWPGGVPGLGNSQGSQGAMLGAVIPIDGTDIDNETYTITSGTANFGNAVPGTSGHNVFLRFKLTSGQTITKFAITT